jgi:hypothetical protein
LQKFNYISVREKTGLDICAQCGINNADWVPDPTVLLSADKYRALYKNEPIRKIDKKYCFLYFINNKCDFPVYTVYDWAKKNNLEVVYVTANSQIDKLLKKYATIPEWIYLLEHAEYVITNSFHCAVFSLIFEKQFGVIPLSTLGQNSRFNSLFKQFNIEEKYVGSTDFSVIDNEINWQSIRDVFENLRKNCKLPDRL